MNRVGRQKICERQSYITMNITCFSLLYNHVINTQANFVKKMKKKRLTHTN